MSTSADDYWPLSKTEKKPELSPVRVEAIVGKKCEHRECGSNVNGWCQVEGQRPTLCMQAVEELAQDWGGMVCAVRKTLAKNLTPENKVKEIHAIMFPNASHHAEATADSVHGVVGNDHD